MPRAGARLRRRANAVATGRAAAGLALAFAAALALVGLSASPAQAQTTFVSNLNQGDDSRLDVSGGIQAAQQFTTGSNSFGYGLTGVDIDSEDVAGDSFSASVCTVGSDGYPTSSCTALTAPGSFAAGVLSFTASPSILLAADTAYAVVMDIGSDSVSFDITDSGGEDTGVAAGWSIANDLFTRAGGSWSTTTSFSFRIAIKGTVEVANTAPTASNNTVRTDPDTSYTFKAVDFNFSDDNAGDTLASVKITTLENAGDLKLDGTGVTLNQAITKADIDAGKLTFTPAAGASGNSYATFGFKVNDGTVDSTSAYTMTIDVTALDPKLVANLRQTFSSANALTVGASSGFRWSRAQAFTTGSSPSEIASVQVDIRFTAGSNFNPKVSIYTDSSNVPGSSLATLNDPASITDGLNTFAPASILRLAANTTYHVVVEATSGVFGVRTTSTNRVDSDGTAGWGIAVTHDRRTSNTAAWSFGSEELRIRIGGTLFVNTLPTARNNTVRTDPDTAYTFKASDFRFLDDEDDLASVKITSLETDGDLELDGTDVTRNQVITKSDIDGGKLVFTPDSGGTGNPYATFGFKVSDGLDDSASAYTMTIAVVAGFPSDATLTALTLQDAATDDAIALSPAFDPTVEEYTASVAHTVNGITITATPKSAGANMDIVDNDGNLFTDVDAVKDGFQINLPTGRTYIEVLVLSEDGNSDDYYFVNVTRTSANPPTASDGRVTTDPDTAYTFTAADFNFSDADGDELASVKITSLEAAGDLEIGGTDVMLNQVIGKTLIDRGQLTFTPTSGEFGVGYATFQFKVNDGATESASAYTMRINVTPPPESDASLSALTLQDAATDDAITLSPAFDPAVFVYTASVRHAVSRVTVTATMNNAAANDPAIVDNDGNRFVDADDVKDGLQVNLSTGLTYIEAATVSEDSNAFKLYEVYVTRAAEPDAAPTASNNTVTTAVDTAYAFTATDFNFADDNAGDTLASVKITTLEGAGDLDLDGSDVEVNDVISRADIDGGKLTFTPASGASGDAYATFGFKVSDGHLESTSAYTMTIDVNTLPTAADNTVTTAEDTNHVFVADDFNFSDDDAGDELASVTITALAAAGRLKLVNDDVRLNQAVTRTQIDEGKLKFVPDADGNGDPYTTFGFTVSDGDHESAAAYTMTVIVTPADDAPTASDGRVTTGEDTTYTFTAADFDFSDADGDAFDSVKITTLETAGRLLVDSNDVTLDRVVPKADIDAGKLTFAPASGASGTAYATFQFKVSDGTLESVDAYTMTIDVTAAQGAVTGALVSNTGQTQNRTADVGEPDMEFHTRRAQQFRTGPDGYVLTSVVAALGAVNSGAVPRVSIHADASGEPGSSIHVLDNPASFRSNRNNTFTVPGKAILRANTNYWVVFDNASAAGGDSTLYYVSTTRSDREDAGAERGWSIADTDSRAQPTNWTSSIDAIRIAIQGRLAGKDATLSALALFDTSDGALIADGSSKLFDAVRFEPDRTEYYAFVDRHRIRNVNGRLGTEITVAPTPSDSRARIIIRERDGSLSVDANTTRPGHQLMMTADGFGEVRRIRVWVTAEDGTTRKTYVVTLQRELEALRVGIHQTPNSTVVQGNDVVFQIRVTDPDPGDDVNLAAIGGSVKFKLAIVCEKRNHGGRFNDWGIRNRLAECQDLTLLGTRGGDTSGFSKILTISDSELQKRTNASTGVETGTMTLRVGTEPDTIQDDGGNEHQNFQENFTVVLRQLSHTEGGPPSFLKFTTSEYHRFTMGSIRLDGHLGDECEYLADNLYSGCATRASEQQGMEPLTAAFRGVPVSHDGSSAFTLRVAFSEDVEVAPQELRDHALSATGGTVTGVTRVDDAKDLFEVTVTPAGEETVSVTLVPPPGDCTVEGAVCTADGRALASVLLTQVRGPGPGLTVADAVATEGDDDSLDFVVTLSPPATETVTVVYATMDGTATAPDDYASKDGTLTFEVGETTKTVSVNIEDDAVEDSGETMTLRLVGATGAAIDDGVAVGTIYNTEPLTASFSEVPSEHDGSSEFTVELDFSEDVEGLSYRTLKFGGIRVTGGTVTKAKRRPPGSGQGKYWTIHVEPDGDGEVTVVLPETTDCAAEGAVCAPDGRMLTNESRATVPGPEGVADGVAEEETETETETEAEPEGLTASFRNVPAEHDGERAFTLRVAFSEALPQGSKPQLRRALSVTGGSTKTILRVNDRLDLWEVKIEPSGTDEVTVSLASTGACGDEAALCTADGEALAGGPVTAAVPGPEGAAEEEAPGPEEEAVQPLTASFRNVPSEHDGESAFTLRVAFSEALPQGSKRQLRRALSVAGGSTKTILRVNDRLDLWEVTIAPSGTDEVTVSLASIGACGDEAALCTADGRALAGTVTATVQVRPGLSVADAEVDEGAENAALVFEVTLDRAATRAVTVEYATSDGTAVAPGDYTSTSGKLAFSAGETVKAVSVPVIADAENEPSETMTLTLSIPTGAYLKDATATGTIINDGPIPRAWLARFGRTVADQVLQVVDGRLHSARAPGFQATFAGQALSFDEAPEDAEAREAREEAARAAALGAWLRGEESEEDRAALSGTRTLSERELFTGTSFALTGGTPGEGTVSAWGRGVISNFDGREGDLSLDGEVGNLMLGADFVRGRATAGLMLSHARGSGGYRGASAGDIEASLTGLYPYGRYEASDRLSVWGVAGYGEGTLTVDPESQAAMETDMGLAMASVGVRGVLLKAPPEGGAELAVKSDAMAVRTTSEAVGTDTGNLAASEADVTRLRLGLEGSRAFRFEGGASLTPSVELGVRHDGGDAETGFGADVGAGLAWHDPARGLNGDVRARGLLTHEDGSFRERGFAGSLAWDPTPDTNRGPSLTLTQTVGAQASGGVEALLGPETARALEAANENDANELERRALEARLGYGIALFDGRYTGTPELGLTMTDAGRETVLGWRLAEEARGGLAFGLDVEAARQESAHGEGAAGHRLGLGFGWRLEGAGTETFEVRFEGSRIEAANDGSGAGAEHRAGVTLTARW